MFPFDEEAGALLVGGTPLRRLQEAEAQAAGTPLADVAADDVLPADTELACGPDVVFSRATVEALREAARARGTLVQASIRSDTPLGRAAHRLLPKTGDLALPLWAGPLGGKKARVDDDAAAAFPDAVHVPICDEGEATTVRVPPHGRPPHLLEIPRVLRLGGRLRHWLHLLDLSLAAFQTMRRRENARAPERNVFLGDVDIHPTATVIGSVLEHGVKVEPHASVIDCWLGKDVLVADHSVLHTCIIGERCRTLVDTGLRRVVAMPGSTLSNLGLSDVVIGRDVFLTTAVATFDPTPGRDAVVDGEDTGRALVGGAIGARCVLGTRALLQAGTALPPGLLVVARPGEAVLKIDEPGLTRSNMIRGDRDRNV